MAVGLIVLSIGRGWMGERLEAWGLDSELEDHRLADQEV
jgi:hypothetical protein